MPSPTPNPAPQALLDELTELAMGVVRDMAGRVKRAATDQAATEAAYAFERAARAVRMNIALQARLARDRRRDADEDRAAARQGLDHRRKQIKAGVRRAIQDGVRAKDQFRLWVRLDERLEEEALFETFADGPVEGHIARLAKALGVSPPGSSPEGRTSGDAARLAERDVTEGAQGEGPAPPPPPACSGRPPSAGVFATGEERCAAALPRGQPA